MEETASSSSTNQQSPQSQLHLQWHQHQNTIISVFDTLWSRQELVDVTLTTQGRSIEVHKVILCACSQYFQELFAQRQSKTPSVIFLKDVEFADLEAIVHFMYKGDIHIEESQLGSFIETAKSLGIRGIGEARKEIPTRQDQRAGKRRRSHEDRSRASKNRNSRGNGIPSVSEKEQPVEQHCVDDGRVKEENAASAGDEDEDGIETFWSENIPTDTTAFHQDRDSNEVCDEMANVLGGDQTRHDTVNQQTYDMENESIQGLEEAHSFEEIVSDGDQFKCPRCGRAYKYKHTVRRHLRYECGVDPQFECHICEAKFHHNGVLIRHMKKHGARRSRLPSATQNVGIRFN